MFMIMISKLLSMYVNSLITEQNYILYKKMSTDQSDCCIIIRPLIILSDSTVASIFLTLLLRRLDIDTR